MENKLFNDYLDNTHDRAIEYDNGNSSTDSLDNAIEEYLYNNWDILNNACYELDKYIDKINELNENDPEKEIYDNVTIADIVSDTTIDFLVQILKLGFKLGYEEASK